MIRTATHADYLHIRELLHMFHVEPSAPPWFASPPHANAEKTLISLLYQGHSFIAIEDGIPAGILLSTEGTVPFLDAHILEEIAWYVHPSYRHTRVAYMLLKAWEDHVDNLKYQDVIVGGIIHTMNRTDLDLSNHGYTKADITYMR